jgi:phospholipid/cholesterol/gamma-HCH transport system substrate-binding protein
MPDGRGSQLARKVSPFKIGLFALICLGLSAGAIIWLKAANMFQNTKIYAIYFNVSIKGLQKDAVVNYRGVPVGRVKSLGIAPDGKLIEVLVRLKSNFRVDANIAAFLREQGLTGLRYLELDSAPKEIEETTPRIDFPTKYPVIKSYPSEFELLETYANKLFEKISSLDLQGLTNSWKETSALFNNVLIQLGGEHPQGDLKETIASLKKASRDAAVLIDRISSAATRERVNKDMQDLTATLASARKASNQLSQQIDALPPGALKRISDKFDETLDSGGHAFSTLGTKINESAGLLEGDLQQLGILISHLNALVQSIKEQPNRLIFQGKEPQEPFKGK